MECALKEWHYLKITPVDSAPVYDRSRHGAKFQLSLDGKNYNDINEDNPIPAGIIAGEITYVGRDSTSYNSTTTPTEAGKYSATSTMTDAVLPESLTKIKTDFEIKPLEDVSSWDSTSFKYDGNEHVPEISYSYDYVKYGKPGTYTINVSGLSSDNYEITYKPGTLTVNDRVSTLVARGSKSGKRAIALSWNSVTDAASYDVYASKCNGGKKKNAPAYIGTTASTGYKVKKIGKKKLQANTAYKFYVVAKDASGNVIARSRTGHFITGNVKGNLVNAKSMTVNTNSATISKGGTFALNAAYKKCRNGKKYKLINNRHAALTRYISEQPAVATVDANGIVTGVSTGWCRIYVQGVSGMWEVVEINVN